MCNPKGCGLHAILGLTCAVWEKECMQWCATKFPRGLLPGVNLLLLKLILCHH